MPTTAEITQALDALSEFEREHFLDLLQRADGGGRFWEKGVATLYHEYVRTRSGDDLASASFDPSEAEKIFAPIPVVKRYPSAHRVALPQPAVLGGDLGRLLQSRRSRREVSGAPIVAQDLSTLLQYSAGVSGTTVGYGYERLPLRCFPSCGGLQSPEIYVFAQNVAGVDPGIYHYEVHEHALALVREGHHGSAVGKIALDQAFVEQAAAVLLVTVSFERLRWKYGDRAYRYLCVDAGGLTQNFYLVGEALGLAVCAVAGFIDDGAERLVGVDGEDELALLLVAIGGSPEHQAQTPKGGRQAAGHVR